MEHSTFITQSTEYTFAYLRVFKSLLKDAAALGISIDGVYLYSLLFNRTTLSAKNHWCDEQGRTYITFSRKEAAETIGWSKRKTIDTFRELLAAGLISEGIRTNRAGCTIAPHIFVKQWGAISPLRSADDIRAGCLSDLTVATAGVCPDSYYALPLCVDGTVSIRARLLYSVALDKIRLSSAFGRIDSDDRVWCELRSEEMQKLLQCGHTALTSAYNELEAAGLLCRERHECGCVMRTYLHTCWSASHECEPAQEVSAPDAPHGAGKIYRNEPENLPQRAEICTQEIPSQLSPSSSLDRVSISRACAHDAAAECKKFVAFLGRNSTSLLIDMQLATNRNLTLEDMTTAEEIVRSSAMLIQADLDTKQKLVRVGHEYMSKSTLLEHYALVDTAILITLMCKLLPIWHTLSKPLPYLRTCLYRAYDDHADEAYYTQLRLDAAN